MGSESRVAFDLRFFMDRNHGRRYGRCTIDQIPAARGYAGQRSKPSQRGECARYAYCGVWLSSVAADVRGCCSEVGVGQSRLLPFVLQPPGKITDGLIGPQGPTLEAQWHQSHRPQQER